MTLIAGVVLFSWLVVMLNATELPATLTKCHANDEKCLTEAIENAVKSLKDGLPEFEIAPLDPLDIPSLSIGAGQRAVQVEQNYKDLKLNGISTAKIHSTHVDLDSNQLILDYTLDSLVLTGHYNMDGKILLLPIKGDGHSEIKLDDLKAHHIFNFEKEEKDGEMYLIVKDSKLTFDAGKATFHFENLFDGDKHLDDVINNTLNENWKEVLDDVKSGYEEALSLITTQTANKLFSKVPISELFLH